MSAEKDVEITLKHGLQTAVVSPYGASLRRYSVGDWNAVWSYSGGVNKKGGQGDVLIPFPSRIPQGKYSFEGHPHQLELNDKDGPNAIHGFLRAQNWETEFSTDLKASFRFEIRAEHNGFRGYPFSIEVLVGYELSERGLTTSFSLKNIGVGSAPVGAGFHPYFDLGDGQLENWDITIPAQEIIELEDLVPTGFVRPVANTSLDFRTTRKINGERYNHCLAKLGRDAAGFAKISVRNESREITLSLNESFDYVVLYTGDQIPTPNARRAFAIEPLTCATDAFNHPEWGLRVLRPGETFSGHYTILAK